MAASATPTGLHIFIPDAELVEVRAVLLDRATNTLEFSRWPQWLRTLSEAVDARIAKVGAGDGKQV